MRVFLSWSGTHSKQIAEIFRQWLPAVLQAVKPYFTPDDIEKGARWNTDISKELEVSRVGLLFLTPKNLDAPWLMFEAGALAKNLDRSRVCPILFGLEAADIQGPLVHFQASQFEVDEISRVVKMMNGELGELALPPEVLDSVFKKWWPELETAVTSVLNKGFGEAGADPRSDRDILEEVLVLTRSLVRDERSGRPRFPKHILEELIDGFGELVAVAAKNDDPKVAGAVLRMRSGLRRLLRVSAPQLSPRMRGLGVALDLYPPVERIRGQLVPDATEMESESEGSS